MKGLRFQGIELKKYKQGAAFFRQMGYILDMLMLKHHDVQGTERACWEGWHTGNHATSMPWDSNCSST